MGESAELSERTVKCSGTPALIPAEAIESTANCDLREAKQRLDADGIVPAGVTLTVSFDEACPLAVQEEAENVREYVRAADYLDAGRIVVQVEGVADEELVEESLAACRERAEREGVLFEVNW